MPSDPTAIEPHVYGGTPSAYDDPGRGANPALDAFAEFQDVVPPVDPRQLAEHHVTAVLVAHDGAQWLPDVLASLAGAHRMPDRIVAVDTGSTDESERILAVALGGHSVTSASRRTGFGAAVKAGIAYADVNVPVPTGWANRTEWIWLLHDDSAPAPDALQRLLECAVRRPDASVIGPKVISWRDDRRLLEVGVSMTRGGRRHTGLEKLEYDQGQHDSTEGVLAVGSAGMLVRRDVWEQLGGFDPHLAMFRDDVDFGWRANLAGHTVLVCPDAVVRHAEAAAHGRRKLGATRDRAHLVDRRNALYVLLANAPGRRLPFTLIRAILGGFARAFGFLLGKQPALAIEELGAVLAVLGRPDRLIRARVARRRTRKVDETKLRRFFPSFTQQVRHGVENVLALVSGSGGGHDLTSGRRAATEPDSDDDDPVADDAWWLKALVRPPVVLGLGLTLLTLAASWRLIGGGRLSGGALFPAPATPAELWTTYTEAWHGVGVGSAIDAPPYLAVIAAVSWIVRTPSLAVDLLLVGSVPLAGLAAYAMLRRVSAAPAWLRFWGAAVYGLLPATTGAIAAGRIGTTTAAVLTPLVVLAVMRTLGTRAEPGPFRAAWSAGLLLAITAAFVPIAWVIAVLLAIIAVVAGYRSASAVLRLSTVLAVAPIVLLPWTLELVRSPGRLLTEAGIPGPGLSDPDLAPWSILLLNPGGPGTAPIWLGAALLAAAWAALFRTENRGPIVTGWVVAATALGVGLVTSRLPVSASSLETPVAGWPGYPTVLLGGAVVVAAVGAAVGLRTRLHGSSFGWRQPVAVTLVIAAGLTPLAAAGWWVVRGADDPLERRDPAVLPAYVVQQGEQPDRIRTLVLSRTDDGRVTYALLRKSGPRLGDAETAPPAEDQQALESVVADLVSGRGGADASALADFAARYVYVPAPVDPGLVDLLDTASGLSRASAPPGAAMWQVSGDVGRVRVLGGTEGTHVLPSEEVRVYDTLEPDPAEGRLLVLAEHVDPGWTATLAGNELPAMTYEGWAQAWELPHTGGELVIEHQGAERRQWLTVQLVAVLLAILLALPGMRRQRGAIADAADEVDDTSPKLVTVSGRRMARALALPRGSAADRPSAVVAVEGDKRRTGRRARRTDTAATAEGATGQTGMPSPDQTGKPSSGRGGKRAKGRRRKGRSS